MADIVIFEQITVSTTAVGISSDTLKPPGRSPANRAILTLEGGDVRYRWDGTDPTASVGHLLVAGSSLLMDDPFDAQRLRLIRAGSQDGTLMVSAWRQGDFPS